ncbi:hypothetical protein K6Y31_20550 [Motilimonas cestriensis]|uniref:Uncharacterized protein n=1 Tax=Motilimonas cestriensis TaxID=2742685 RepID=A0ABS8WHF8_9GAMM|nr:hypothetical protein [Motilimonas cestriensis]MCE2597168.1 hypothetical protein [Motilimonas cestriensis]
MNFEQWLISCFGKRGNTKAARYLGVSVNTVQQWATFSRFPSLKSQELLKIKSDGAINFDVWRTDFLNQQMSKARS